MRQQAIRNIKCKRVKDNEERWNIGDTLCVLAAVFIQIPFFIIIGMPLSRVSLEMVFVLWILNLVTIDFCCEALRKMKARLL